MINDERADVLARATRRLREEQDAALAGAGLGDMLPAVGDPTWSRIVTDVRRARRRTRIIIMAIALQLAVGLGGVGFAAVTGRLAALVRRPSVPPAQVEPSAPARRATRAAPSRALAPAAPAEAAPDIPAPPSLHPGAAVSPPAAPAAREPRRARPAAVRALATAAPGASAPASTIDLLYREAHRLHFARRDFAAALDAWDRFLAAGAGPLVLEARYNRAIALAHLGRRGEAISALRPFAEGEAAAYRQREARALIERFSREE